MKKLLTLVTLLMTLLAVPFTASAERSGAKASGVPFNKTKVVYLKSLEKTDGEFVKNNPQFRRDEDAVRLTYLGLQKSLKDEGVTLYNNPVMLPDRYLRKTLTMQVVVNYAGTVPLEGEAAQEAIKDKREPVESLVSLSFLVTKGEAPVYRMTDVRTSKEKNLEKLIRDMTKDVANEITNNRMKLKDVK